MPMLGMIIIIIALVHPRPDMDGVEVDAFLEAIME
jgi:hypothetical protein